MNEIKFLDENNVSVSNSRFIVNGQTYAISNVTSVKLVTNKNLSNEGAVTTGFWLLIIGVSFLLPSFVYDSTFMILCGFAMIGIGILLFSNKEFTYSYSLVLSTSAGEIQVLENTNKSYIENIVSALNQSIVSRG